MVFSVCMCGWVLCVYCVSHAVVEGGIRACGSEPEQPRGWVGTAGAMSMASGDALGGI